MNLSEILQYQITAESLSVFNESGSFSKVQKSKLIQRLNLVSLDPRVYLAIVGTGMIWQMPTPTQEDQEKVDTMVYAWGVLSPRLSISLFLDIIYRRKSS